MENRQPWLCQLGSARSLKSPALSPSCLSYPSGDGGRGQAGWLCSPTLSASPVPWGPELVALAASCLFPSPVLLEALSHGPPHSLWHPNHLANPKQASGSRGHTPWDSSCIDPAPNGCQRFALIGNRENNILGHARRTVASTSREVFSPARHWGCCHG